MTAQRKNSIRVVASDGTVETFDTLKQMATEKGWPKGYLYTRDVVKGFVYKEYFIKRKIK